MFLSWTSLGDFPPFLFLCRHICFHLWNETASRTVLSKRQRKGAFPATQLVLPAGPGLGSFRLHNRRVYQGIAQRPGYPLLCLFGWHGLKRCKSHREGQERRTPHPVSCSAAEPSQAPARDSVAFAASEQRPNPKAFDFHFTASSSVSLGSPACKLDYSHPQTCWQAKGITHVNQKQFANINNF